MKIYLEDIYTIYKDEILAVVNQFGGGNVRVFGSILKGWVNEKSDVDFLITLEEENNWQVQVDIEEALQLLLGCEVDVLTEKDLPELIREKVISEAIDIQSPRPPIWTDKNLMLYVISIEDSLVKLDHFMSEVTLDKFIESLSLINACKFHLYKIQLMLRKLIQHGSFTELEIYLFPNFFEHIISPRENHELIFDILTKETAKINKAIRKVGAVLSDSSN